MMVNEDFIHRAFLLLQIYGMTICLQISNGEIVCGIAIPHTIPLTGSDFRQKT